MIGLLISLQENEVYEIELDDKDVFKNAYNAMECDTIEVIRNARIGDKHYDIFVDEAGALKENMQPSAKCSTADEVLLGSIIIIGAWDKQEAYSSLTKYDLENIDRHIYSLRNNYTQKISPILEYAYGKVEEDEINTKGMA